MVWEHSYAPEAYDEAWEQLNLWSVENLAKAYSEFSQTQHKVPFTVPELLETYSKDVLVDLCMQAIQTTRLCDNGGWAMWVDEEGFWKVYLPQQGE
jgi:hypothetical protein